MDLKIIKATEEQKKVIPPFDENLGFGKVFSDHMFMMEYKNGNWENPVIKPYENLVLPPSAMVLHYGQGIFEGLKAYRNEDKIYMFRPKKNMFRMNQSARRLVMPSFDGDFVLSAIQKLVMMDKDWIPTQKGQSLYIRPTMVATEPFLGVRPSESYLFFVIVGPVGNYYSKGFGTVDIFVTDTYVRAVVGGVGEAKAMGNYAASLLAQKEGQGYGCGQVLWLDGVEKKYVEEVGAMNIFVRFEDELVTPMLSGSILPGVTRDSVIRIAQEWGIKVSERKISIEEVISGIESGKVMEMFGTGTAAVISPVGKLVYKAKNYTVGKGGIGELSQKFYDYITSLQVGMEEDKFDFVEELKLE